MTRLSAMARPLAAAVQPRRSVRGVAVNVNNSWGRAPMVTVMVMVLNSAYTGPLPRYL